MKYAIVHFILILTIPVFGQPSGLEKITETLSGWRLIGQLPQHYGPIGLLAVDLSIASIELSDTYGATGNFSMAAGAWSTASGDHSFSLGHFTVASGEHAVSIGAYNQASGQESTALGYATNATGLNSVSMGNITTASGDYATVSGLHTVASGYGTTAVGIWNTIDMSANATSYSSTNRAFVIGNGTASNAKSNAMTVLFNGNTTIAGSVTAPSFIGNGSGLTNLPVSGLGIVTENSNTGWRLAAHNPVNYGNIGSEAVDLSLSTSASTTRGATGNNSIAMGSMTIASGSVSTAMGSETMASGRYSTAIGRTTTAAGFGTTSIGTFNTIDNTANATSFSTNNRAFVIGNGSDTSSRSDAMTVLFNGTTNIAGSVSALSFIGDGYQLENVGLKVITEQGNTGWRLTGQDSLNYGNIGSGAIDLSMSGTPSSTRGATGINSFAAGDKTTAAGSYSTAMGTNSRALGNQSTALGYYSTASAEYSTAMGGGTNASGELSTAMGVATTASGLAATALGSESTASGNYSQAMGHNTTAAGYGTTSIGLFNTVDTSATSTTYSPTNRALVIGNGTSPVSKSDAMTVLFDGTTIIAGDLTVNSDARLKSNIKTLGNTLSLLQQLDGKTYNLRSDESKEKIGLLAQDVQVVFPQLVREAKDEQRTLSVNYQGLIPVLINAVNEQQKTIDQQQKQIEELTEMMGKLLNNK